MAAKKSKGAQKIFKVTGNFKKGKSLQKFTKEIIVDNKQLAEEYVYSIMGSKHRLKRKEITIDKIEEIAIDDVTDTIIKQIAGGK